MCDLCPQTAYGWRGWNPLPPAKRLVPVGEWIDLTHEVSPTMPCASIFPTPSFELLRTLPQDPFQVTLIHMVAHAGTHVDAPLHYYADGPDMASIPLDRMMGAGVVWHVDAKPNQVIDVDTLERCRPLIEEGDIVALDTGWAKRFGTEPYEHHPSLSADAAHWLADKNIKLLAVDFATPDLVYHLREPGFNWPVHRALLSQGILVCEHLTGHATLAGERVEFNFNALPIVNGDGAPARVTARRIQA